MMSSEPGVATWLHPNARMTHRKPRRAVRIGCSGWQYKHWRGSFYPTELPTARWLEYYATQFDTVEINNSFYRLPEADTFAEWRRRVPRSFVYAVKASRYLTHLKKLKEPGPPVALFFSRARTLGQRLGPVLYQLPPRWPRNLGRLETFLRTLPRRQRHAIEFRDPSWYCNETFELLNRYQAAICLHDMAGSATGKHLVGPFVYLRLHGPQRYTGRYSDQTLEAWAEWCAHHHQQGKPVYAYFNNDARGDAPRDALRLRELCERYGGRAPQRRRSPGGTRNALTIRRTTATHAFRSSSKTRGI